MKVELVRVTTSDGMFLDGALSDADLPEAVRPTSLGGAFDAALLLHGVGSNFYQPRLLLGLSEALDREGLWTLRANTRGHDGMHTVGTTSGARLQGAAMELVRDCVADIDAWIDALHQRGRRRILLLGHSLGAIKAVYWASQRRHASVAAVAALSPPRLSAAAFAALPAAAGYAQSMREAEAQTAAGEGQELLRVQFPFPMTMSAATYVDKYGGERYNILQLVDKLTLPSLFTYGERELDGAAFAGLPELLRDSAGEAPVAVEVLDGADHSYAGHMAPILDRIQRRLAEA